MSRAIITESKLTAIADAIRAKTGGTADLTVDEMASEISTIDQTIPIKSNYTINPTESRIGYTYLNSVNYLCKPTSYTNADIHLSDSAMTSFRAVLKARTPALSNNEKYTIFYEGGTQQVEADFGRWSDNARLFLSVGFYNNSWTWAEIDLPSPFVFDETKFYYFAFAYADGTLTIAIYDENGTTLGIAQKERTKATTTSAAFLGAAYNGSQKMIGEIDIGDSYLEKNGIVLWGRKTSKTTNMGIIEQGGNNQ